MPHIPSHNINTPKSRAQDLAALIPDFPFHYGAFLNKAKSLGEPLFDLPSDAKSKRVLVIGAGASGTVAAYELLRMGLQPVLIEASDRIGGRLNAHVCAEGSKNAVIAELGAMRFPVSGKAGLHYFEKTGMRDNSAPFPNPGSEAAVSTVVDFQGEPPVYYEVTSPGNEIYPKPEKYDDLEREMFGEDGFLNQAPMHYYTVQDAMESSGPNLAKIKEIWNDLLLNHGWDNISFRHALVDVAKWSPEKIELFGQIGFGTGGWNTDFPNGFLEVMRVLYTGLDVDHQLMYDGTSTLPRKLLELSPAQLGDVSDPNTHNLSVLETTRLGLEGDFPSNANPFNKEARHFQRLDNGKVAVWIWDSVRKKEVEMEFDAVIYTPHVRILDKFRHYGEREQYQTTTALFDSPTWEAIQYTHYMQSAKIFMAATEPFWKEREGGQLGKHKMSITLSDRLPRGTYLVDYSESKGSTKGCGIFLSYTWNDDSLKFLGDPNVPAEAATHADMCRQVLHSIYPDLNLEDYLVHEDGSQVEIHWENEPYYLGAFKMNLPGDYERQRRLFSQFMNGVDTPNADRFILAGDDVSWVAGWVEGAISTAINAVNKVAVAFGGGDVDGNPGPISSWETLKPVELPTLAPRFVPHR
ncbi:NAD(P)/FAD-dependent oxidoreductase [Arthrobacter sp. NPDC080086]|uniref:flavin monoamine oxidase family protein n=1 Tax=Arthrobacter sp. NPDC080086 TaxID=3155917 RepID=UPI00344B3024